jgi:hypothetical protein
MGSRLGSLGKDLRGEAFLHQFVIGPSPLDEGEGPDYEFVWQGVAPAWSAGRG